ncbi:MAG: YoaP domain-containing protein, partial [Rikenellaceae bacterium]|nr:YoaP domain-containing protein [Rikenellaceae bacterium]
VRGRGMKGILIISSPKKRTYRDDRKFLMKQGFAVCDTAEPYFELMVKMFGGENVPADGLPRFAEGARTSNMGDDDIRGVDIFYTAQCPFTVPYIGLLKPVIEASGIPVRTHRITAAEQAQGHCCPVTAYSVFVDGAFRTHEILTPAKLEKLLSEYND